MLLCAFFFLKAKHHLQHSHAVHLPMGCIWMYGVARCLIRLTWIRWVGLYWPALCLAWDLHCSASAAPRRSCRCAVALYHSTGSVASMVLLFYSGSCCFRYGASDGLVLVCCLPFALLVCVLVLLPYMGFRRACFLGQEQVGAPCWLWQLFLSPPSF